MLSKRILTLVFVVAFLTLLVGCLPGITPSPPKGVIGGRIMAPPGPETTKDITGWIPLANATVTITDSEGVTHTVTTDEDGYYTFTDIAVNANTIISASGTVNGNTVIVKDVIPQAVAADEDYEAGIADAESTALALIVEELLKQGVDLGDIDLEEILGSDNFNEVVEQVNSILEENGNVTTDPGLTNTVGNLAEDIINPPGPSPEPSPPPVNHAPIITSIPIESAIMGVEYIYDVEATDPDGDTLTYSLTTNPNGMAIDPGTGVISWIPTAEGEEDVIVEASDGELSHTQSFIIIICTVGITGIEVLPETMTLFKGESKTIQSVTAHYVIKADFEVPIPLGDCTYDSDTPEVATASNGVVTAVEEGEAIVTVSYAGKTDEIAVTVLEPLPPVHNTDTDKYYDTIQLAINDPLTLANHTIEVAAGEYNLTSPISVDKTLTLTGDTGNPVSVIINAPTGVDDKDCFQVVADGVTIEGFRIQGAKDVKVPHNWNSGIAIGNYSIPGIQNTTISYNEITDCSYGIYVYRAQYVTISDNKIWGCTADSEGYWNGKGIHVYGEGSAADPQPYDIDILNNEIYDNELFGIELNVWIIGEWIDVDMLIDGNTIYNNGGPLYWDGCEALEMHRGISANDYIQGVTITNNEIFNHLPPTGSSFYGGSGIGIRAYGVRDWTINNNDIHDNVRGIYVYGGDDSDPDSTDVAMNHNDVYENAQGIVVGDGDIGYANDNNICDNNVATYTSDGINPYGVVNLGTLVFDATYNWWGSEYGPKHNGFPANGGDAVSDNVDYSNWNLTQ